MGYYVNDLPILNDYDHLISCTEDSKLASCETIDVSGIEDDGHYYFINNGLDQATHAIIDCTNQECVTEKALNGYYMTGSTESIIACHDGACELKDVTDSETRNGGLQAQSGGTMRFCIDSDCEGYIEFPNYGEILFERVTVAGENDFPGASAGDRVSVRIGLDNSIRAIQNLDLPKCTTCTNNTPYCLDEADGLIKKYDSNVGGNRCKAISGTAPSKIFFFTIKGDQVTINDAALTNPPDLAYECRFDNGSSKPATSCRRFKGYTMEGEYRVVCPGVEGYPCSVTRTQLPTCGECTDDKYCIDGEIIKKKSYTNYYYSKKT